MVPQGSLPWSSICRSSLGTHPISGHFQLSSLLGALHPPGVLCSKIPSRITPSRLPLVGPLLIQRTLCLLPHCMEPPLFALPLSSLDFSSVRQLPVLWLSRPGRHASSSHRVIYSLNKYLLSVCHVPRSYSKHLGKLRRTKETAIPSLWCLCSNNRVIQQSACYTRQFKRS